MADSITEPITALDKNIYGYNIPQVPLTTVNPDLSATAVGTTGLSGEVTPKTPIFTRANLSITILVIIYGLVTFIAVYHAYVEYSIDAPHIKYLRLIVVFVFPYLYIPYVLFKSFFLDFLKSASNRFDFSFMDKVLNIFGNIEKNNKI
jgi:hypothetical protein